jgi:hypothetical protein
LVRETLRTALAQPPLPCDLIFVLRPQVLTTIYPARLQAITDCLRQFALPSDKVTATP